MFDLATKILCEPSFPLGHRSILFRFCAVRLYSRVRLNRACPSFEMNEQPKILLSDLYKAAVGDSNHVRYLKRFKEFHRAGASSIGWNWAAFFCTGIWLVHRKMWGKAIAYVWLSALGMAALVFLTAAVFGKTATVVFASLYLVAMLVLPAMFADGIYYRFCRKMIRKARAEKLSLSPAAQRAMVEKQGGTWNLALVIAVYLGIGMGVPIFHEYKFGNPALVASNQERNADLEDQARLDAVAGFGAAAGKAVTSFHRKHRRLPLTLAETALGPALPPEVRSVHLDPATGELSMILALTAMEGRTVKFVPYTSTDGTVQWRCYAGAIAARLVPEGCTTQRS